jgi:hypothetical protein
MLAWKRTTEMYEVEWVSAEGKEGGAGPERLVFGLGGPYADTGYLWFGVCRRPKKQAEPEYGQGAPSIGSGTGAAMVSQLT